MKVTCSTGLEESDFNLIARIAAADSSTPAHILRKAILAGLPSITRDVLGANYQRAVTEDCGSCTQERTLPRE